MSVDERVRTPRQSRRRPRVRRRRPVRRFVIVSHRWLSLVLGLVLLAITTSGALLLYRPELERAMHADAYAVSGRPAIIDPAEARDIVLRAHPGFAADGVWAEHGVFRVTEYENSTSWTVDPGTGRILGHVGAKPAWIAWTDNLHECLLSCEGEPGTLGFLVEEVPGTGWLGFDGAKVTWGGLVLGGLGVLLAYLSLTGIWLWFPRPRAWRSAMRVRRRRGRFARDADLHKVAGMVVVPFLLVWAVTGAGFELGVVEKGWFALTPGDHRESGEPVSARGTGPDVSPEQAVTAAQRLHPDLRLVNLDLPGKDDPTAAYSLYFQRGVDAYAHTEYPGNLGVFVDRRTGVARDFYGFEGSSISQIAWDEFSYPVHSGYVVTGWWRLVWLVLALSPLLLAITGVSTWLVRHQAARNRRRARRHADANPAQPAVTSIS